MMDSINNSQISPLSPGQSLSGTSKLTSGSDVKGASFADTLKQSIDEVVQLQKDASQAVQDLATGKTEDVTGVLTAMEKSDLAFKTLLTIRNKLMEAYEEIRNIQI